MRRGLWFCGVLVWFSGCTIEYNPISIVQPSYLERIGCSEENNEAASPEERPVAVCETSFSEINPIFESTDFIGRDSYDPNGHPLIDYRWTLVQSPLGSQAKLGEGIEDRWDFRPDLAGTYTARLQVTNDQCVMSDPCEVTVRATPAEDLWVEMFWSVPGDDMDLHLIEGNGEPGSDRDCFFENCVETEDMWRPDFGVLGSSADDPFLDLDDIEGKGPENINIMAPAAGRYRVAVHDFPGSVKHVRNDVTVVIHLDGDKVFEETRPIHGEDKMVFFAEVEWPSMAVKRLE